MTSEFDASAWVERRHVAGKCACGECQCRAQVAFEARKAVAAARRKVQS